MSACRGCGRPLRPSTGRPRLWCSQACRRRQLYGGRCERCGKITDGSRGRAKAPSFCHACHCIVHKQWTREAIVEAIQRWAAEHDGRKPGARAWNRHPEGYPNTSVVQREFGTWNAAIEAAGFTPLRPGRPASTTAAA